MKILLFGAGGQVGWELRRALAPLGDVVAISRRDRSPRTGDLDDLQGIGETVRESRPDIVVNAAAYTAVDRAESEPELAHRINAEAPAALAQAAQAVGAWMVHYGTDYVFDGTGTEARTEDAAPAPLNVYGRSKLAGEQRVREGCTRHLILRTSWVYAARGQNFLRTMLRLAAERDELRVIDDQQGAPTGAELVADVTAHAILGARATPALAGTYHLAASGTTSWHGYARHVIAAARAAGAPVRVADEAIHPIPTSAYHTAAKRPLNSRLDTGKLRRAFGLTLPDWRAGVDRALMELHGR